MEYRKYSIANILVWLVYPAGLLLVIIFMFLTCGNNKIEKDSLALEQDIPGKGEFGMPQIPGVITEPGQRAAYLVLHYWDNFDFSDTLYMHLPEVTEQAFADYLDILPHAPGDVAALSIGSMLGHTLEKDSTLKMYRYFLGLYKSYLCDANSPLRDDEYYIPVTRFILEDSVSVQEVKERARFDLSMMLKNRKGDIAADIAYTTSGGKNGNLHSLDKAYTLLYFYNPDCHACKQASAHMQASPVLNNLLENGRLDILALYPDQDISLWKRHTGEVPARWVNAYDKGQSVRNEILYDLKAIPSLYLLDARKQVLLKDADIIKVEEYLARNNN